MSGTIPKPTVEQRIAMLLYRVTLFTDPHNDYMKEALAESITDALARQDVCTWVARNMPDSAARIQYAIAHKI